MTKASIGLGVLSIPTVFDTLGIIPGVICLVAVGVIITWSGYVVGTFKQAHPEVYGVEDAGALMFGRIGREVFGAAFALCMSIPSLLRLSHASFRKIPPLTPSHYQIGPSSPAPVCSAFPSA